jgi:predicted ATP-dependent Lon-type protease
LVTALTMQERVHVRFCQEVQAGIDVGRAGQTAAERLIAKVESVLPRKIRQASVHRVVAYATIGGSFGNRQQRYGALKLSFRKGMSKVATAKLSSRRRALSVSAETRPYIGLIPPPPIWRVPS